MATIIKSASVKVMLSYNYNHFEASMSLENESGLLPHEIDNARKDCQRLCDKAVAQYQVAKNVESSRTNNSYEKEQLTREVLQIRHKDSSLWSPLEKAKVKALEDDNWERQYDYQDDFQY